MPKYTLEVLDGFEPGTVFAIEKPRTVLGRKNCDVVLEDPEISRHHAQILIENGEAILEDLGSTNGTYLEGCRIEREVLRNEAVFRMGTHQLVFRITNGE